MKDETLDLIFVMDRSGSMGGFEEDTIGGFNSLIERERKKGLETYVTTVLFDDDYEFLYKRKPINEVEKLTDRQYWVRGCTALLDAVGKTINAVDHEIKNKVLFVIMTDGMENASREFKKDQIRKMIESRDWEFIFIGADIDSFSEASSIGIRSSRTANYRKSKEGFGDVFESVENASNVLRCAMDLDDSNWNEKLKKYD